MVTDRSPNRQRFTNANDCDHPPSQTALVPSSQALGSCPPVPVAVERAGPKALLAADEYFAARISNPHTRRAYARVVRRFLGWCEKEDVDPSRVSPGLAGRFIDELPGDSATKNQALAALRHFFDRLVSRQAVPLNPFLSVRGRKQDTAGGKTPGLSIQQARDLLGSIDTSHVVGLRDRALLGTLAYTGARIGAVARLRRGDLDDQGTRPVLRFGEKGGKQREIPVRHDLNRWLGEYLEAAGISEDPKETPLFRSALGKQRVLSARSLSANSMGLMLKRRLKNAGLPPIFSPHSFRVLVVTDLLSQDVPLEDVQYLAGHVNPRTTQIYDRRRRRVTRNIVERISV